MAKLAPISRNCSTPPKDGTVNDLNSEELLFYPFGGYCIIGEWDHIFLREMGQFCLFTFIYSHTFPPDVFGVLGAGLPMGLWAYGLTGRFQQC